MVIRRQQCVVLVERADGMVSINDDCTDMYSVPISIQEEDIQDLISALIEINKEILSEKMANG